MIIPEDEWLEHYGIKRRSGRYPWGSGQDPAPGSDSFLSTVEKLKREGLSEAEIARGVGLKNTTQLRARRTIAINEKRQADINMAERLKAKGMSNVAIGERMGINESSVRNLLAPGLKDRTNVLTSTANMLKDQVAEKGYLDIGAGVEHYVGVNRTKLNAAVAMLKEEGYDVHYVKVKQLGTGLYTTQTVLVPPGTKYSETYRNRDNIGSISDHTTDGGRSFEAVKPPTSISSKRIGIRYADEGGAAADGVVYVRRGKPDLSLGGSNYAQVRIAVDGTHYIKGMAMYKDDMPDGVDLLVNVNKKNTGNKLDALKPMKRDPDGNIDVDNPFGATIKAGGQRGVFNIVNEEGNWEKWSRNLSSQMLSKQSPSLARTQLNMTYENRAKQLDEIRKLTNPTVRQKMLTEFADGADSAAVHLKAAAIKGTANHVILPVNSLKDNEVYAPNYPNGTRVALVRHPHGGPFEIPDLVVNNRNPEARRSIGTSARDAIGINHKVAGKLSGADFDGDAVLVIPNNDRRVKSAPSLAGLKDFDPISSYPAYDGMIPITPRNKQKQMGDITNLIADMSVRGANSDELARAVRHSMVVIDAEKHNLDYKGSARDNGIAQLKEKYQEGRRSGASTLITRAGSEVRIPVRRPRPAAKGGPVDRETGKKVFEETGEMITNRKGQLVKRKVPVERLSVVDDAHTLSSGTVIEKVYADHSNRLKDLANQARKESVNTKGLPYSPSAKAAYSKEVASLGAKLRTAQRNAPLERQAQVLANAEVALKTRANPGMESSDLKKIKAQALARARARTGAHKQRIDITDQEWAAIQAGAITPTMLKKILDNADGERIKQLATPRPDSVLTGAKKLRAQAMLSSGYTQAEVANALGVSVTTLKTIL